MRIEERKYHLWQLAISRLEVHIDRNSGEYIVTQLLGTEFTNVTNVESVTGQHHDFEKAYVQYENRLRDLILTLNRKEIAVLTAKLVRIPQQRCGIQRTQAYVQREQLK